MEHLIGQSLDRYELTSLLGEGGMGAVFKARDITLQRDIAVKIMHPQFARRPNFRERFLQEARTAANLDHPGIVKVFDFGEERNLLFIVMEFIPGADLRDLLRDLANSGQWILLDEAVFLVRQASLALHYAHRAGVLHRDIKPDNIMLKPAPDDQPPYNPVITDLGLAKLAEGGLVTQEGASMGTPAYMSPEQALGEDTDARSDVYSLGILLYELAVGRLPFPVRSLSDAVRYHTKEPPPPPRSLRPDLPESLGRIIVRAIAKKPGDRFPDARALADSLSALGFETAAATAAPTAFQGAVSLMTQYQKSLVEPRGSSLLDEFPQPPADLPHDRIVIRMPDGSTRSIAMKPSGLTIGRTPNNDIVLDHPSVSRRHARIDFEGTAYQVTDLDSTNGTYLGSTKLLPGMPQAWSPDSPMRIGGIHLALQRADVVPAGEGTAVDAWPVTGAFASTGAVPDGSLIQSSAGTGSVGVFLESNQLSVSPGAAVSLPITILNQGSIVDHFATSIKGIPPSWIPSPLPDIRLLPGDQQQITLSILPPRVPESRAGRHRFAIRVASQENPTQVAQVACTLSVALFSQFSSKLHPQSLRPGKPAHLSVQNNGNAPQSLRLSFQDRADELEFDPPRARLNVAAGRAASAQFRASPKHRRWFGSQKQHPFSIEVASPEGDIQTHSGELVSKALLPAWVLGALIFLCVVLAAASAVALNLRKEQITHQSETATASYVAQVQARATVAAAAAATSEELARSTLTAQEAAIATADWGTGDDDRDGITNAVEMDIGTLPGKRDTDEDGLSDGEEKYTWKTDPLDAYSDGDGLKDGDEVSRGLDPMDEDTDDDGIPDDKDPSPGQASSPTPDLTATEHTMANEAATARAFANQTATALALVNQAATEESRAGQTSTAQASQKLTSTAAAAATERAKSTAVAQTAEAEMTLTAAVRPDLVVESISFSPSPPVADQPTRVRVQVKNNGSGGSGDFSLQWWADRDLSAAPTCEWTISGGLSAGGTVGQACEHTYDSYGSLNTRAVVDTGNKVSEEREDNNAVDMQVGVAVVRHLFSYDENNMTVPDLARAWEFSDDGLMVTFQLRQGVQLAEGREFVAHDVKSAWDDIPNWQNPGYVDEVDVIDDYTIQFIMWQYDSIVLDTLSEFGFTTMN